MSPLRAHAEASPRGATGSWPAFVVLVTIDSGREVGGNLPDTSTVQRDARFWHFANAVENFATLHALIEEHLLHIDGRLCELAQRDSCPDESCSAGHTPRVLAKRAADGSYEVRESAIVTELGDLHRTLAVLLDLAADACRDDFRDATTADFLRDLAEHHKKDASMLRALLWEDHRL